jgi:hypothetical protein
MSETKTKSKKTWVTLYCDASSDHQKSGWAVYLRSEKGRIIKHGKCPSGLVNSTGAEFYAVLMGIEIALAEWGKFDGIFVNSDCTSVCRGLWPWSNASRNKDLAKIQNKIRKICADHGILVRTKHVKGHQNPKTGVRSFLNGKVDGLSRKSRKE